MPNPTLIPRIAFRLLRSPARGSAIAFALFISVGSILLMLPAASAGPALGWIDALFMATSAVCVTGLTVLDVGSALTPFGQGVILSLIQVGGLGILTISTLLLLMMRGRPTLSGQAVIKDTFTYGGASHSVTSVLKSIFTIAFTIEAVGALLLYLWMAPERDWLGAIFPALFHSVSAFCNAGFSLYTDSFAAHREDWFVNCVLCSLIILGGLGFVVIAEVKQRLFSDSRLVKPLSLHSRLALMTSAILIAVGTVAFLAMEWTNTLAPLSIPGRVMAAFFHSVTARTAGFNTLNIGVMANETLFLLCILMFIGASPGSCGGGVKTTTFASLIILGISRLKGLARPHVFRRTIAESSIAKATSIILISAAIISIAVLLLMMTEVGGHSHAQTRGRFLELLFEAVSAFGTVGLSTGATSGLSAPGRLIITMLMFIGRLGPMVIALALSRERISRYQYAEETIMIG